MAKRKSLLFLFLLFVLLVVCAAGFAAEKETRQHENGAAYNDAASFADKDSLRIALCHLDLSQGPQAKNIEKIEKAIRMAGEHGAHWIITPETALQGYYFYVIDPKQKEKIEVQPSDNIRPLLEASSRYGAYLFLGAGEYDKQADRYRNSCLIFGPEGKLIGRHSKLSAHVGFGAEVWSTNAYTVEPIVCDDIKIGALVCSDIWFLQYPRMLADKGAQIIIDIAAWPPTKETGDPLPSWELASARTKLPVVICNQTGKPRWMDMTPGQSAVVENGKAKLLYSGEEAVLLFDWNHKTGKVVSEKFEQVLF
ncbi:MAG: carbon-nitrogen hydrolase family protein [Acidaminococcaceae bacterium]|nr:carbon-nitrogen hydrolase family protein [Acidaminococcaceae bacterium]